jgi:chloramphenicol O-acetyltransferase type A
MYEIVDISAWPRRQTFAFFKEFDDPFFNLTALVDCTDLYRFCKERQLSFFLSVLHHSQRVVNGIEAFRTRLNGEEVRIYDKVHCGSTILHKDNTFSFCYFEHDPNLTTFVENGLVSIERQHRSKQLDPRPGQLDIVHYSVIPWVAFTGYKNARHFDRADSVPKIVFGKMTEQQKRMQLPVSVEAHHALCDGYHLGQYFAQLGVFEPPLGV